MAAKFLLFIFFLYFTLLIFTLWGMLTVALTPNPQVAAIVSAAAFGIWNLFAGFLIPRPVCSLLQSSLLLKSSLKLLDQLTIRRNTCFVALSFLLMLSLKGKAIRITWWHITHQCDTLTDPITHKQITLQTGESLGRKCHNLLASSWNDDKQRFSEDLLTKHIDGVCRVCQSIGYGTIGSHLRPGRYMAWLHPSWGMLLH
jgi:hypothetical protein